MDNEKKKDLKPIVDLSPSPFKKFLSNFIKADRKSMGDWFFKGVVYPGIQNLILEGLSMLFFDSTATGKSQTTYKSSLNSNNSYNYNARYNGANKGSKPAVPESTGVPPYDNIVIPDGIGPGGSREAFGKANDILSQLSTLVEDYDRASLLDLYSLIGLKEEADFQHDKWGWNRETWGKVGTRRVAGGYLLVLNPPIHLEN